MMRGSRRQKKFRISSPLPSSDGAPIKVSDLISLPSPSWNLNLLAQFTCQEDLYLILSIPLSSSMDIDELVWVFSWNGEYSVCSGYAEMKKEVLGNLPSSSSNASLPSFVWKKLWSLHCSPKVKMFWCRTCQNALASGENIKIRLKSFSSACPICFKELESVEHILFRCSWTREVWGRCHAQDRIPSDSVVHFGLVC